MAIRRAPKIMHQKKAKPPPRLPPKRLAMAPIRKIPLDSEGWQRQPYVKKKMMVPFMCKQDIRTGAIIGRGTERQGLYYVDEVTQNGIVMLSHGTAEREAWLWHRRLGHPSTSYLHVLFPKLFPSGCKSH
ncbi:putative GAG-pre-integrase domain-containing protein [Helianthus annuus]|uniref:GAG-pre-integrase domain-containing protein n=1 Tax=Helianthus annuus TaxID=4232 RepID=A0A9K3EKU2_HELAN|nr:putative GAG-pre-integrase domain-containing protein [Helianthus annuus]KAJ0482768.1 putative GAG-pre-integrase domain-containing protein [Helianthus annuus]KAJ0850671.1 putative GAG-pre-integrase domain-containing protein [Helianthus annuus]KAJ0859724.1 putative GAG-pre-integrase domain-containing protein [Helianthus annuus]